MRTTITYLLLLFAAIAVKAQKKPLDHSVYDAWQSVQAVKLTADGRFTIYEINPQEGDGTLYIRRNKDGHTLAVPRGYKAVVASDGLTLTLQIKAPFSETLAARKKNKKADDMPKDSLAMVKLSDMSLKKWGPMKGYKTGVTSQAFVAYEFAGKDKKAGKDSGKTLIVVNTLTGKTDTLRHASSYAFSPDASQLMVLTTAIKHKPKGKAKTDSIAGNAAVDSTLKAKVETPKAEVSKTETDSIPAAAVLYRLTAGLKPDTLSKGKAWYGSAKFSIDGSRLVFLASTDTMKTGDKHCSLFLVNNGRADEIIAQGYSRGLPEGWTINQNAAPEFSRSGRRVILGVAPLLPPNDTTIYASESAQLDIWSYKDFQIQPMQKVQLEKNKKYTYLSVINLDRDAHTILPLTTKRFDDVTLTDEGDGEWAVSLDRTPYYIASQWDAQSYTDVSLVNTFTGARRTVAQKLNAEFDVSPNGNYLMWYRLDDSSWYTYSVATGKTVNLTAKTGTAFYDEDDDHPNYPPPYDYNPQWTAGDKYVVIADRYDLWQFAADGSSFKNLTRGYGRANRLQMRNVSMQLHPVTWSKYWREKAAVANNGTLYLSVFDEVSKKNGFATVSIGRPQSLRISALDTVSYARWYKATEAPTIAYVKGNFRNPYDLYLTFNDLKTSTRLTAINPQMANYFWGTAQLVHWTAYDGTKLDGIMYMPENMDPTKKYPLIAYFYERSSETLYNHLDPRPSRSIVNIPFYVSRGYMVFVPDIVYKDGHPGESAYNCIISGVEAMCNQFPMVDKSKMALQGQSWGGYQTAYLITRTNMFAAAEAGAPVSNMTSAYGGIRWASGVGRLHQYEHGQSRIGKDLWQEGGLDLYLENSPLFRADKVNTPLLIMHNDNDGAVPWYQGIEYFMALRRLGKPVWLLQYNKEEHNLVERRNTKDLSIRIQQFFDHYLKGAPEPAWMKTGVPATRKGQYFGTELSE